MDAADARLFVDDCDLCGREARFTGRFAEAVDGRHSAIFHCPGCRGTYRVWRRGLAERWTRTRCWILLRHDAGRSDGPVPQSSPTDDLRDALGALWHAVVREAPLEAGERGRYVLDAHDQTIAIPDASGAMHKLRRWASGPGAELDPASPVLAALACRHEALIHGGRDARELIEVVRFCRNGRALMDALGWSVASDPQSGEEIGAPGTEAGGWRLIAGDLFDRDAPPRVQADDLALESALRALWLGTLRERVRPGAGRGLVAFHLQRGGERIGIHEDFAALGRLRDWIADASGDPDDGAPVLDALVAAHARLWRRGRDTRRIVEAIAAASDLDGCVRALGALDGD